jgi:hypothetical protein
MATKRGYYRSELLRSIKNIEMALTHLLRVVEAYSGPHPEVAIQAGQIGQSLAMIAELIQQLHDDI